MSTVVSSSNYEYQGQVYSPAFSEPASPMSTTSDVSSDSPPTSPRPDDADRRTYEDLEETRPRANKRPRFANKYEEQLQPLAPATSLSCGTVRMPVQTHQNNHQWQKRFQDTVETGSASQAEAFLRSHYDKVDVNRYNREGRTPLQQCCLDGNLPLASVLVRHGADWTVTTRDGFSTLQLAVYSGLSNVFDFVMDLKR